MNTDFQQIADWSRYGEYIAASYVISMAVIAWLVATSWRRLKKAEKAYARLRSAQGMQEAEHDA